MTVNRSETRTGGRPATTGVIPGDFSLSVGRPNTPIPNGWRWTALNDVARLESGHTPSRQHPEYWGGDIPWIGIKDATANHGRVLSDTLQHTNQLGIENSSARILPKNTVCLSRTASVGYVVVMGKPMATSQDFVNWVCSPALDHMFLKYVLLAEHNAFLRFASGTTHQTIYFPEVKAFHIGLPPLSEQRSIAHILGTLDDKIELNRKQNETLEAMARALFKAWFVDFEPVRAKLEGRWRRGQSLPGLPTHLFDLFPERLVESELGEIPEGWRHSTIGEEVTVCGGSTPSTQEPEFWEGGHHCWATPKDLSALKFPVLLDTDRKVTDAGLVKISSGLLPVGTVLLSSRAPIGYLAIAEVPTAINQGFIAMKCDGVLPNVFVLQWCRERMDAIVGNANGSTFQEISKSNFRPISVVVPSEPLLASFTKSADSLYRQMLENERESCSIAQIRDTLLPKLISGELRVPDAEKFVVRADL